MSDIENAMASLNGGSSNGSDGSNPPAKPSAFDKGITALKNFAGEVGEEGKRVVQTFGEGGGRSVYTMLPYAADVADALGNQVIHSLGFNNDPKYAKATISAIEGQGPQTQDINRQYDLDQPNQIQPKNDFEKAMNELGQGAVAGVLGGGGGVLSGLVGAGTMYGVQKAAPTHPGLATAVGLATAALTHHALNRPTDLVAKGRSYPEYEALADHIIPSIEVGGTIEAPRVSPKGAEGPMQVMPGTKASPGYGVRPSDGTEADTVREGRDYLAALLAKYDGDPEKAMAAYNDGPGNIDKIIKKLGDDWTKVLPHETLAYISKGMIKLRGEGLEPRQGPVSPMAPEDIAKIMNDPEAAGLSPDEQELLNEVGKDEPTAGIPQDVQDATIGAAMMPKVEDESVPDNVVDLNARRNAQQQGENDSVAYENLNFADRINAAIDKGVLTADKHLPLIENARNKVQGILDNMGDSLTDHQTDVLNQTIDRLNSAIDKFRGGDAAAEKPVVDNTGYEKFTPNPEQKAPANDTADPMGEYLRKAMDSPEARGLVDLQTQRDALLDNLKSGKISPEEYDAKAQPLISATKAIIDRINAKPYIDPLQVQATDKVMGQEPTDSEPINDNDARDPVDLETEKRLNTPENLAEAQDIWNKAHENAIQEFQQPDDYNSALTRQKGGTGRKFTMTPEDAQGVLDKADEAVRQYWQSKVDAIREELGAGGSGKEPPPPGGGGNGIGGDGLGGGEEPPSEGTPGGKYADSINLDRLLVSPEMKDLFRSQVPQGMDIQTHTENIEAAQKYIKLHTVKDILSGDHKVAPEDLANYRTAIRMIKVGAAKNLLDLAKTVPAEDLRTPEQDAVLRQAFETSARATTLANTTAKQFGRGLAAGRIYIGGNKALNSVLDASHISGEDMDKVLKQIRSMPDQAGEVAADAMKPGWLDYVKSGYYGISLLSRLTTSLGIFASVGINHVVENVAHIASMAEGVHPQVALAFTKGEFAGFKDVPKNVAQAFKQGIPTHKASLMQNRVNLPAPLGVPSKLIASVDEFFGTLGRSAEAYSQAAQRAYAAGFRGQELAEETRKGAQELLSSPDVIDRGKAYRLQDRPTPLGQVFKAAVNNRNPAINIAATLTFPFVNIADRLAMNAVRMTPGLSFTDRITQADFKAGGVKRFVAVNRQLIGLGLGTYALSQVLQDNLTGQGPSDANKKALWLTTHQADSVKIDGKWFSYERLPFASLISAVATATERYQETGNKAGYWKTINGVFTGAGAGLLHSHYLEGVSNLADTFSSGSSDKVADFFGRTVKSFIPGLEQQINESIVDPTVRDTKGNPFVDEIKSGIMGESQTLPARHNVLGDVEHYDGGVSRMFNPFPVRDMPKGQGYQDLTNSGVNLGYPNHRVMIDGEAHTLSEQGLQKYIARSGQIFKQNVDTSQLRSMSPADRQEYVRQTMHDAREQARQELFGG